MRIEVKTVCHSHRAAMGIQGFIPERLKILDSRFRGNDDRYTEKKYIKWFRKYLALLFLLTSASALAEPDAYLTGGHCFVNASVGYGYMGTMPAENSSVGATDYQAALGGADATAGGGYLWYLHRFAFGAKLAYSNYHDSYYTISAPNVATGTINYASNTVNLLALGQYAILAPFNVFLGLGESYAFQTVDVSNVAPYSSHYAAQKLEPTVQFGFTYRLIEHLSLSLDMQYMTGDAPNVSSTNWDPTQVAAGRTTNLGLIYTF